MFDESYLISRIKQKTGYQDVSYAEDSDINLIHLDVTSPRIYVGHLGIKLQHPENLYANGYTELDNPEVLVTAIQFLCARSDLAKVRTKIKNAYIGYSPFPDDANYSSLVFLEASMVAKTSTKVWWSELIGLVMPRVS